jgi:hypothetical protein
MDSHTQLFFENIKELIEESHSLLEKLNSESSSEEEDKRTYLQIMVLFRESLFNLINSKDYNEFHVLKKYKLYESDTMPNITMLTYLYETKDSNQLYFIQNPLTCEYNKNNKTTKITEYPVIYYHLGNRISVNYDLVKQFYDTDNIGKYKFLSKTKLNSYNAKMNYLYDVVLIRHNGIVYTFNIDTNVDNDILDLILQSKVTLELMYEKISEITSPITVQA